MAHPPNPGQSASGLESCRDAERLSAGSSGFRQDRASLTKTCLRHTRAADRDHVRPITEEEAHLAARVLIEEHGASVAAFVNAKVTAAIDRVDPVEILRWTVIRNAVSMALQGVTTRQ